MGDVKSTVYFLPIKCIKGNAARLPKNAPNGGIEPIHEAMFLFGSKSGEISIIEGMPGAEYPRTKPMQKYDTEMHTAKAV